MSNTGPRARGPASPSPAYAAVASNDIAAAAQSAPRHNDLRMVDFLPDHVMLGQASGRRPNLRYAAYAGSRR
jgi:hypothetical protein